MLLASRNCPKVNLSQLPRGRLFRSLGFSRFLRSRRSLRAYRSVPVDKEKLKQILEAGRFAPTGANRQALRFTVVRGRKALDRIAAIALRDLEEQGKEIGEVVKVHRKRNEPRRIFLQTVFPPVLESTCGQMARRCGSVSAPRSGPDHHPC